MPKGKKTDIDGMDQKLVGPKKLSLQIKAARLETLELTIVGTAPYVQEAFGPKAHEEMMRHQAEGDVSKSKKVHEPKDFPGLYEQAKHKTPEGWCGIPANGLRAAMISACRAAGVVMTRAKLAVSVLGDGLDIDGKTPLVRITKGEPTMSIDHVRNADGSIDLRARPVWAPGWEARVRIIYDADMIDPQSVANLLARAGMQVGTGAGRNDSKKSAGMGWGSFTVKPQGNILFGPRAVKAS